MVYHPASAGWRKENMTRLTEKEGDHYKLSKSTKIDTAINRLGQYEDTNYTPHQINMLKAKKRERVEMLKEEANRIESEWRRNE